jgi:hypothetical protein
MKNLVINGTLLVLIVALAVLGVNSAMSIPDMMVSYSTGECVSVINYADTNYSCENQPQKYNHIWVN